MRIDISESLSIQLEEMSGKEFRTPKLQIEFILTRIFADGEYSIKPKENTPQAYATPYNPSWKPLTFADAVLGRSVSSFTDEDGNIPLADDEKLSVSDLDEVAKKTIKADHDPTYQNDNWGDSRRAFEVANAEAQKKLPRLTNEQAEELRGGHVKRKAKTQADNSQTLEES